MKIEKFEMMRMLNKKSERPSASKEASLFSMPISTWRCCMKLEER